MTTPKFLGYMVHDFNLKNGKSAHPLKPITEQLKNIVTRQLVPKLDKAEMLLKNDKYSNNYCLGEIQDSGSLIAKSQEYGLPVFALSEEQLGLELVSEEVKKNIHLFNDVYQSVAEQIINL